MKYHEKLRFLNKSYFNKTYIVLVLSFTYMAFDIFITTFGCGKNVKQRLSTP